MQQINFTKEHLAQLEKLLTAMLFSNVTIKGPLGTILNAHQLLHETSIKSLQSLFIQTSKDIESQSKLDKWSMTDYQQQKLKELSTQSELLDLIIGYKKFQAQQEVNKAKLAAKKEELQNLKDSAKTPAERISELEKEIASYEV